jgi:hypothetical protein
LQEHHSPAHALQAFELSPYPDKLKYALQVLPRDIFNFVYVNLYYSGYTIPPFFFFLFFFSFTKVLSFNLSDDRGLCLPQSRTRDYLMFMDAAVSGWIRMAHKKNEYGEQPLQKSLVKKLVRKIVPA